MGLDIGGSGMKAAMVEVASGSLVTKRHRAPTPRPATPEAMTGVFDEVVERAAASAGLPDYDGPIGCTFPGVVHTGSTIRTAANLDPSWIGVDAAALFGRSGRQASILNDADAAGLAEMRFGAGREVEGVVVVVTIGTGLGTAVFNDGALVPNTELGHVEIDGLAAETRASGRVVKEYGLSLEQWAPRFERYLRTLEELLWPDLFILGGGISKRFDEWSPMIETRTSAVPASLRNEAGIVGAAMYAAAA